MNRRQLLKAALGLPLLPSLMGRAHAQAATFPKRLLVIYTPNGTLKSEWRTNAPGGGFGPGPLLAPLATPELLPHLSMVDGLDYQCATVGDNHVRNIIAFLTARTALTGPFFGGAGLTSGWAAGPSVDQYIAGRLGAPTLLRSLELGVKALFRDPHGPMVYRDANLPMFPENDPRAAFLRLFGGLSSDPAVVARLRARRLKIVDVVRQNALEVRGRLAKADKLRIDEHLTALSTVEQSLSAPVEVPSGCVAPSAPVGPVTAPGEAPYFMRSEHVPLLAQQQTDLAVAALSCDLTRVVTLQFDCSQGDTVFSWLGGQTEAHHELSHDQTAPSLAKLRAINLWYAERVAELLTKLKAVPEGSGTLLDHTLVLWGNELNEGANHDNTGIPFVLAGGLTRPGQFLDRGHVAHNPLLVTVCRAMGLTDVTRFGDPQYGSGHISSCCSRTAR